MVLKSVLRKMIAHMPMRSQLFVMLRRTGWSPPPSVCDKLPFSGEFDVQLDAQTTFRLRSPGYGPENKFFWIPFDQRGQANLFRLWASLSRDATVIFDIGAHVGIFSLIAAAVNPHARVYGFEPVADVFERFQGHCALNGFDQVTCVRALVSDEDGTGTIYYEPNHLGSASMAARNRQHAEEVPKITLDTFADQNGIAVVDLIKIDVEFFEVYVLRGMKRLLASQPIIMVEVMTDDIGHELENLLPTSAAYRYFRLAPGRDPQLESSITGRRGPSKDYLLCPEAKARQLGLMG